MSNDIQKVDLTGKYVVIKEKFLNPEYHELKFRVVKCIGGFGCKPFSMGKAVFVKFLWDGEESRWNREHFERLATDEEVQAILKEKEEQEK